MLFVLAAGFPTVRLSAQETEQAEVPSAEHSSAGILKILGRTPDRRRFIPVIWAMHPFEPHFPEVEWTHGFGAQFKTFYVGTFINSYGERAFIGGLEREWADVDSGPVGLGIGYRLGLVSGYDERLFDIAEHTPLLPFIGLLGWAQVGLVNVDAYYVYRAITLEASVRF